MRAIAAMLLVLAVSCSDAPDLAFEQPSAPAEAWRHVQRVDGMLPQRAAAIALTDREALSQAWAEHGFRGAPPRVDSPTASCWCSSNSTTAAPTSWSGSR